MNTRPKTESTIGTAGRINLNGMDIVNMLSVRKIEPVKHYAEFLPAMVVA